MTIPIPQQIRNGLARCRTALQENRTQIEACVADMARDESVDLSDELERLTSEGDGLRRRLRMYEDAASVAVENQQVSYVAVRNARVRERCDAAIEAAIRRTQCAEQLDNFIQVFKVVKNEYEQADEHARIALWQAASDGLSYQEADRQHIDGSCRLPVLDEIAQVLLRYHHEPNLATASGAREIYIRSVVGDLERVEPIDG